MSERSRKAPRVTIRGRDVLYNDTVVARLGAADNDVLNFEIWLRKMIRDGGFE